MKHRIFGLLLLPALWLPLSAQALSLQEAAQLALRNDPRVFAAEADFAAAQSGVEQARAGYRPSLGIAAEIGRSDLQVDAPFPESGIRTPNSVSAQLTQPLYTGGRLGAQLEAARSEAAGAQDRQALTRQQVLLYAVTAYLNVQRDRSVIALNEANLRALRTAAEDTGKRFNAGEATRTDVAQANARVAEVNAALAGARATLRASEASFRRVIGVAPDQLPEVREEPSLPQDLDEALRRAEASPALREARQQLRVAQAGIDSAKSGRLPQLSFDAAAQTRDNTEFGYDRLDTWSALVKLQMPIYQGGAVDARIGEARAREAQARYAVDDAARSIVESVTQSWEMLQATQQTVPAYEAQVEAAELALDGVRKELDVGSRTTLDLLDAERELLSAQINLISARRDRSLAAYRLLASSGELELAAIR